MSLSQWDPTPAERLRTQNRKEYYGIKILITRDEYARSELPSLVAPRCLVPQRWCRIMHYHRARGQLLHGSAQCAAPTNTQHQESMVHLFGRYDINPRFVAGGES